jgi:hypothetical protein
MFERESRGHYESFFVRANHPSRPLAFWVRYTLLVPAAKPDAAVAELWAIAFDGERERIVAVKERHPLATAAFDRHRLSLRIGAASFEHGSLRGAARSEAHRVAWALDYDATHAPLLLLPERMYEGSFPKAKSLVPVPLARFRGALEVDGEAVDVEGWVGSQNHNWGARHTDRYAWGQVAGFDDAPEAFLECATAQLRFGPIWTPQLTVVALRLPNGEQLRLNTVGTALRAHASRSRFEWRFESAADGARVSATLRAPPERFVALRYDNPEGRPKICLNSKLARCELRVERRGKPPIELRTEHRAAFEILGDDAEGLSIAF